MFDDYTTQQIITCAALMLAVVLFRALPSTARWVLVITLFSAGVLAGIAGAGQYAIARTFG